MTYLTDLNAREAEIIRTLKVLGSQAGKFIVVGGYAVNALDSHRFSVDCDLVVAQKDLRLFDRILKLEGYRRRRTRKQLQRIHRGKTVEYIKLIGGRRVSVDLFVNSMVCRQTGGAWSYELIRQNSIESNVTGLTDSALSLVPRRELLMAMKIHSGRPADLRDLTMLSEGAEWKAVARFAARGVKEKVIKQVASAIGTIGNSEFPSALRAEFGLRLDATALIKKAVQGLNTVKKRSFESF